MYFCCFMHRRMGHGFRFLLPPFLYYPLSFFKIFIIIPFSKFDNISRRHTSWIIRVYCIEKLWRQNTRIIHDVWRLLIYTMTRYWITYIYWKRKYIIYRHPFKCLSLVDPVGRVPFFGKIFKLCENFRKWDCYLRNNSWKPYVYIVFTTGRPLCHEVLPRAKARGKKLT